MKRHPYHPRRTGEFYYPPGARLSERSRMFRLSQEEFRRMLGQLRDDYRLSMAGIGMYLGVPRGTVISWLRGKRKASGAAIRMVWLMHIAKHAPDLASDSDAWCYYDYPGRELGKVIEERAMEDVAKFKAGKRRRPKTVSDAHRGASSQPIPAPTPSEN